EVAPDVPAGLRAVVARCLRRAPDERYAHVADLAEALVPFAGDRGRAAARSIRSIVAARPATLEDPLPEIASAVSTVPRTTRREASGEVRAAGPPRLLWPGAVLAALVGAAVIVIVALRTTDAARPEASAAAPARAVAAPIPAPVVTPLAFDAGVAPKPVLAAAPDAGHRRPVARPAAVVPDARPPLQLPDAAPFRTAK